jgi:beta-ketodecanoyl-[acyl-carrier-protein] synthase
MPFATTPALCRAPKTATPEDRDQLFRQEGRRVFKEVCPMAAEHISSHLGSHELAPTHVRRFWLHQANLSMNQFITRRLLGRDATLDEAPVILDEFANTASAGSIIAFHRNKDDFQPGEVGVICSFGAGVFDWQRGGAPHLSAPPDCTPVLTPRRGTR